MQIQCAQCGHSFDDDQIEEQDLRIRCPACNCEIHPQPSGSRTVVAAVPVEFLDEIEWHCAPNGKTMGPMPFEKLCDLIKSRQLGPNDMVWNETFTGGWLPLEMVPKLKALLPPKEAPRLVLAKPQVQPAGRFASLLTPSSPQSAPVKRPALSSLKSPAKNLPNKPAATRPDPLQKSLLTTKPASPRISLPLSKPQSPSSALKVASIRSPEAKKPSENKALEAKSETLPKPGLQISEPQAKASRAAELPKNALLAPESGLLPEKKLSKNEELKTLTDSPSEADATEDPENSELTSSMAADLEALVKDSMRASKPIESLEQVEALVQEAADAESGNSQPIEIEEETKESAEEAKGSDEPASKLETAFVTESEDDEHAAIAEAEAVFDLTRPADPLPPVDLKPMAESGKPESEPSAEDLFFEEENSGFNDARPAHMPEYEDASTNLMLEMAKDLELAHSTGRAYAEVHGQTNGPNPMPELSGIGDPTASINFDPAIPQQSTKWLLALAALALAGTALFFVFRSPDPQNKIKEPAASEVTAVNTAIRNDAPIAVDAAMEDATAEDAAEAPEDAGKTETRPSGSSKTIKPAAREPHREAGGKAATQNNRYSTLRPTGSTVLPPSPHPIQKPAELSQADIQQTLHNANDRFTRCYNRCKTRKDKTCNLSRLNIQFKVQPTGKAAGIQFAPHLTAGSPFKNCLQETVSSLQFPAFDGAAQPVNYPLIFSN